FAPCTLPAAPRRPHHSFTPSPSRPPGATLFPYTTLFRSRESRLFQRRGRPLRLDLLLESSCDDRGHDESPLRSIGADSIASMMGGAAPQVCSMPNVGNEQTCGAAPRSEEHTSELQSPYDL